MRLTDISVRKLPLMDTGQKIHYDDSLPGFGVRVSKTQKAFVVMYDSRKRNLKTLGRFPDQLNLAEARAKAKVILATHTGSKENLKYHEAVENFIAECEDHNRPSTVRGYELYLSYFESKKRVADISRADIQKHLKRYKDKPSGYSHSLAIFKIFFNWCLRQEIVEKNPIAGEKAINSPPRDRVLTENEIRAVWAYSFPPFSTIVKLCLLTGQRRSEIARIEPEWIEDNVLVFPPSVMKNKQQHSIPLTSWGLELLADIPFSKTGKPWNGWSNAKRRLDRFVDIEPWVLHDLRRTNATLRVAKCGAPIHLVERQLAHVSGSTTGGLISIYHRYDYMDELRKGQEDFERCLKEIINET